MDSGQIEMLWQSGGCIVTALGPITGQMTGCWCWPGCVPWRGWGDNAMLPRHSTLPRPRHGLAPEAAGDWRGKCRPLAESRSSHGDWARPRGQHCSGISIHLLIWVAFEPNCSLFHLSRIREAEVKPNLEIVFLLLI